MPTVCEFMVNRSDIPVAPESERIPEEEKAALYADYIAKKERADVLEAEFHTARRSAERAYTKHYYAAVRNVRLTFTQE